MWVDIEAVKHEKKLSLSLFSLLGIIAGLVIAIEAFNTTTTILDEIISTLLFFVLITYLIGTIIYLNRARSL